MKYSSFTFLFLTYLLLNNFVADAQQNNNHPNIVLIVSDDHGREAVGCYGSKVVHTPNIDALAKEGILFTNAFATVANRIHYISPYKK